MNNNKRSLNQMKAIFIDLLMCVKDHYDKVFIDLEFTHNNTIRVHYSRMWFGKVKGLSMHEIHDFESEEMIQSKIKSIKDNLSNTAIDPDKLIAF